ncbi:MAG: hypothetical protein QOF18_2924 [Frankiaceae bacterium]|nr:hypothetical protein [Frankiaceae bacterium]
MVPGRPGVLATAANAGTQPGCGDCEWTLILACLHDTPTDPHNQTPCAIGNSPLCPAGQTPYRLYLTTDAVQNRLVDTLCLGGTNDVIPVGDIARTDVERYLKDVVPPALLLTVQPPNGALAGLPAYFTVRPPADLAPRPFGSGQVVETITIVPQRYVWMWGDGTEPEATRDAGAPYPDGTLTHTYAVAGHLRGSLTTRWSASYTITVAGGTFGPYPATGGPVERAQPFALTVTAAHSHLVSH